MAGMTEDSSDIGLIGLAVMGKNLVLNMRDHKFKVCVFNRSVEKIAPFVEEANAALVTDPRLPAVVGATCVEDFVRKLKRNPRVIMLLVQAGNPVDEFLDKLVPLLEADDIVIDGGNSKYTDTETRVARFAKLKMHFVGCGVSGGEEGARNGPSIMPGGSSAAWPHIKPLLQSISATVADGSKCCEWLGEGGSGHFVKMVHNGIEYGDMQLICEAYAIMRASGMENDTIAETFKAWNASMVNSFLIEITALILARRDEEQSNVHKIDLILDVAGQKGTGQWTVESALQLGAPITLIAESVFSRLMSANKEQRVRASAIVPGPKCTAAPSVGKEFLTTLLEALYLGKLISYAQGFAMLQQCSERFKWNLDLGKIALIWRGGCIIRSSFLKDIHNAFSKNPKLDNLLLSDHFAGNLTKLQQSLRQVIVHAVTAGVPVPAFSTALAYYDAFRSKNLPANLLQAQRDLFGAHTYERIDRPRGQMFHTEWYH